MHAFTAMAREIRKGKYSKGLILANGGVATYQYAVCLSNEPRKDRSAYPSTNPLPVEIKSKIPQIDAIAEGEATIETYTVEFGRDGKPERGHIVGLSKNGHRFIANNGDASVLHQLASSSKEPIGRSGRVIPDPNKKGRNLFYFDDQARL